MKLEIGKVYKNSLKNNDLVLFLGIKYSFWNRDKETRPTYEFIIKNKIWYGVESCDFNENGGIYNIFETKENDSDWLRLKII